MIVKEKIGHLSNVEIGNREIDYLQLDWFETGKRILHKKTTSGQEVVMKFLRENQQLSHGDILFADDTRLIVVAIRPCESIIINPRTKFELASICFEIGNKHLPLFYQDDKLLVAYDAPLFRLLVSSGYDVIKEDARLENPLKTSVSPHSTGGQDSLFSKIMKLTSPTN